MKNQLLLSVKVIEFDFWKTKVFSFSSPFPLYTIIDLKSCSNHYLNFQSLFRSPISSLPGCRSPEVSIQEFSSCAKIFWRRYSRFCVKCLLKIWKYMHHMYILYWFSNQKTTPKQKQNKTKQQERLKLSSISIFILQGCERPKTKNSENY